MATPREEKIQQWEEAFAGGLVANSRDEPEPWLGGHVHVARDLPPQPEFARTDPGPVHQLLLLTDGATGVQERIAGSPLHLDGDYGPGTLLIFPPEQCEEPHLTRWEGFGGSLVDVMIGPEAVRTACRGAGIDYGGTGFIRQTPTRDPLLEQLIRQLGAELEAGAPGGRLYAEQLMQTVAVHLVRHYTSDDHAARSYTGGVPPARLRRVKAYVEAHLSEEIQLEDLAEEAEMSQYHFCRQFKKTVGQSPYQYVIEQRVEEGKRLLQETDRLVAQVAFAVGYESQSRFTQQFKRRVGTTPGAFRKEIRA